MPCPGDGGKKGDAHVAFNPRWTRANFVAGRLPAAWHPTEMPQLWNYQAPRSWAERAYQKLIYYNKVENGGHFAAWEQPQLSSEEVRAGFRQLRKQ